MENNNLQMKSEIMGNAQFSRFYAGLRQFEKKKALEAMLAKDSGGASKPKKNTKTKVCISKFYS